MRKHTLGHMQTAKARTDQNAHLHSLIRAFAVSKQNHWILQNASMENRCPDDVNPYILSMLEGSFSLDVAHKQKMSVAHLPWEKLLTFPWYFTWK